jgi:hypothetical protein
MNHLEILKRAFHITWRYRPLWIFGFLLALCGGGNGGGGNFNFPSGSGNNQGLENFGNLGVPEIDPNLIIAIVVALVCLILLLAIMGVVVQYVTRTALFGMVQQIEETGAVTTADGWRFGWSKRAWRIFLLNLLIGLPLAILTIGLILLALAPLLLLILDETTTRVLGVVTTVVACLLVLVLLLIVNVIIAPIQELAWRRIALDQRGVIDSLREAVGLIKRRLKDVALMWLLMFGVGILWTVIALIVVLPVALIAAAIFGGIPAAAVYLLSNSWVGAAIAGVPLGVIALVVVISAGSALFLIYQSAVWTLTYLQLQAKAPETSVSPNLAPGGGEVVTSG